VLSRDLGSETRIIATTTENERQFLQTHGRAALLGGALSFQHLIRNFGTTTHHASSRRQQWNRVRGTSGGACRPSADSGTLAAIIDEAETWLWLLAVRNCPFFFHPKLLNT